MSVALGWHVTDRDGTEIIWHNGGTGGYRSIVAVNREAGTGIVILTNAVLSLDALAVELMALAPARPR
jgi:CubicO group peptidase (beta-lactamase class C family)